MLSETVQCNSWCRKTLFIMYRPPYAVGVEKHSTSQRGPPLPSPHAVELVLVLPDDNSHGTEKSAAKGWESAPWGGAIENGQHERKDCVYR